MDDVDAPMRATAETLRGRGIQALATNITYLGIASPTNAQVVAQVRRITMQVNALIRLTLGALDTDDGT